MRFLVGLFILLGAANSIAQKEGEEAVQRTIERFFEGFHAQDSVLIKGTVAKDIILQTVAKDPSGRSYLKKEDFGDFLKSLLGIPKTTEFEERLLSLTIQVDGDLAHVWTPYEFWINGNFSHRGANSFELLKEDGIWKIIYLVDTRRKEKHR